ncbi:hypothetical protein N7453_000953 [Penicillium expansum]|nr:hypothetical protein N7453_000953 [Penicillium expansum]
MADHCDRRGISEPFRTLKADVSWWQTRRAYSSVVIASINQIAPKTTMEFDPNENRFECWLLLTWLVIVLSMNHFGIDQGWSGGLEGWRFPAYAPIRNNFLQRRFHLNDRCSDKVMIKTLKPAKFKLISSVR